MLHCGIPGAGIANRTGQTWPLRQHIVVHVTSVTTTELDKSGMVPCSPDMIQGHSLHLPKCQY